MIDQLEARPHARLAGHDLDRRIVERGHQPDLVRQTAHSWTLEPRPNSNLEHLRRSDDRHAQDTTHERLAFDLDLIVRLL
jgi:hypothetical protein